MKTLYDLFIHELKDIYSAAGHMHDILNRMSSSATDSDLVQVLKTYYNQSQYQKDKLREFSKDHPVDFDKADCPIMKKLQDHGVASMRYEGSKEIRDIALLLTVQLMKHFEITAFGTVLTHANSLNREEIVNVLLPLKKKVAEEEKKPFNIASTILEERSSPELKKEAQELLGRIIRAHIKDEDRLLEFLPETIRHASSDTLREALETYQTEHQGYRETMEGMLDNFRVKDEISGWSVMDGFTREWKEHLSTESASDLKDVGIIMSIQRIQHQNMALFAFVRLLSQFIENSDLENKFLQFQKQEEGNDQSFTAVAEGSLFSEGLDTKVKP